MDVAPGTMMPVSVALSSRFHRCVGLDRHRMPEVQHSSKLGLLVALPGNMRSALPRSRFSGMFHLVGPAFIASAAFASLRRSSSLTNIAGRRQSQVPRAAGGTFDAAALKQRIDAVIEVERCRAENLQQRWRMGRGARYDIVQLQGDEVRCVRLDCATQALIVGTEAGKVLVYELERDGPPDRDSKFWIAERRVRSRLECAWGSSCGAQICDIDSEDGVVLCGSVDGTVRLYDTRSFRVLHDEAFCMGPEDTSIRPFRGPFVDLTNGIATVAAGCTVRRYAVSTDGYVQLLRTRELDPLLVSSLAVHDEEIWLGTQNGLLLGMDSDLNILMEICPHARQPVTALCVQPYQGDGPRVVFTGSAVGDVSRWKFARSSRHAVYSVDSVTHFDPEHEAPVVALQADDQKVVSGAWDGTVRAWGVERATAWWTAQWACKTRGASRLSSLQFGKELMVCDGTRNLVVLTDFGGDELPPGT